MSSQSSKGDGSKNGLEVIILMSMTTSVAYSGIITTLITYLRL